MKAVGVIAEYNPFHTGHQYHLAQAKKKAGACCAVVVMSPDFVQRGEPALFDKFTRARMALLGGADLVLELPVCYATASAEYFAQGSTVLLDRLGVVDALCFGGESDDPLLFEKTARLLTEEPPEYRSRLKELLRQGMTFPQARSAALGEPYASLLSSPNNILGTEYCRALQKQNSSIRPLPLRRKGAEYHSETFGAGFCSATALRSAVASRAADTEAFGEKASPLNYIPEAVRPLFAEGCCRPVSGNDLMMYLTQKLLSRRSFEDIFDISQELSNRICTLRFSAIGKDWAALVSLLKTRQFTEARIRRALLHLILDITGASVERFRREGTVFYGRILGFRKTALPLLHEIKRRGSLPLISRPAAAPSLLSGAGLAMWEQDVYASHLYRSILAARYGLPFKNEYALRPVILNGTEGKM